MSTLRGPDPHSTRFNIRVGSQTMPIDPIRASEALDYIESATNKPWSYVVTPNAQHLQLLREQPELGEIYAGAGLSLADGWPVAAIGSVVARSTVPRVPGSDLMESLLRLAGRDRPLVFVGGETGDPWEQLARRCRAAGWVPAQEPAPRAELQAHDARAELVARVARHADGGVAVIGIGAPRQEILAREICDQPGKGIALCLGMSINFSSGAAARAPRWMQRLGLEWIHRAAQEPRRLIPRYAGNLATLFKTTQENTFR